MTRACCIALAALALAPLHAQDDSAQAAAIERFAGLDFRRKAVVIRTIQRQLGHLDDPALRRIAAMTIEVSSLPDAPARPPIHDPSIHAREEHDAGRAPSRTIVPPGAPAHRAVRERFARPAFMPELIREIRYDWQSGRIVKADALGYDDLFANFVHGFAPGSDHAVARVQQALDVEPAQRALARWFGHAYCDLEARAFPPITLYDAWYSGKVVDVPDVDAIPFARDVLGWKSYRSPLSGPPRDRLYEEIRRHALKHRVHRTMCEAAAAAFVRAEPDMDPTYARLVPRFHYLFARLDDDVEAVVQKLADIDRDRLVEEIDANVELPDGEAFRIRDGRRQQLAEMQAKVSATALAALEEYGG